jgi:hypothetical protein
MNYNKPVSDTSVRIGEVRFSYANVFSPKADPNGKEKYSCSILIPKSNKQALKLVEDAIEATKLIGKSSKWGGKIPANCKSPLRDGDIDREDDEAYAGMMFINASATTKSKPVVRFVEDGQMFDALDEDDFYSGCYGAAVLNFFPYDSNGNKGVGCGLNVVVKTRDGEKFSGGVNADAALADLL